MGELKGDYRMGAALELKRGAFGAASSGYRAITNGKQLQWVTETRSASHLSTPPRMAHRTAISGGGAFTCVHNQELKAPELPTWTRQGAQP